MNEALSASSANKKAAAPKKRGLFARIALFFRQVLSELKKVQRPTRQELGADVRDSNCVCRRHHGVRCAA